MGWKYVRILCSCPDVGLGRNEYHSVSQEGMQRRRECLGALSDFWRANVTKTHITLLTILRMRSDTDLQIMINSTYS